MSRDEYLSAEGEGSGRPPLSERLGDVAVIGLLLTLAAFYFFPEMVVTIYPGQAGIVWDRFFGGTRTDVVYGEGVHIVAPWNRMYSYDVRIQDETQKFTALSQHGLPIDLTVSIRYRPAGAPFEYSVNRGSGGEQSLGELHKRVGPDYVTKLVIPVVGAAARTVIGRYRAEELYHMRRQTIQDEIIQTIGERRAKEQFAEERYVDIIDTLIRDITLPETVREAIHRKLAEEQAMLTYDFILRKEQKEAERKGIEAEGIRKFQQTVTQGVTPGYLRWQGINATLELAKSTNAKVVVIGGSEDGLPLILNLPDDQLNQALGGTAAPPTGPAAGTAALHNDTPAPDPSLPGTATPAEALPSPELPNLTPVHAPADAPPSPAHAIGHPPDTPPTAPVSQR